MSTRSGTAYMKKERRIALRVKRTVMGSTLCAEALVGWKGLQAGNGNRMCCFFSCSTSLKNLTWNVWLDPPLASLENCQISCLQRWTHSHLAPVMEPVQYCMNRAHFSFSVLGKWEVFWADNSRDSTTVPEWGTMTHKVYTVKAKGSGVRLNLHPTLLFPWYPQNVKEAFPMAKASEFF